MKKRLKIVGFSLLILAALLLFLNYQAKRIVISLIESGSDDKVKVSIGQANIHPSNSSIRLRDVSVQVRDRDSESFKRLEIGRVFLDVASLWDFFSGGTLVIEKFECEGANLSIFNPNHTDTTKRAFNLDAVIQRIKTDAVRFRIEDIVFRDLNLTLAKDSILAPTTISHIYARAQNLYLSADSIEKEKPIVEFYLPRQVITLPSQLSFGFDSLSFSTTDNSMQVLNLELKSPSTDLQNVYHIHSDKVRLAHFNFQSLYKKGDLQIDSIFLGKSNISVDWLINKTKRKDSVNQGIPALPRMDIRSIVFQEIISDVVIRNDSIQNTFKVERASLTVNQFRHRPDSSHVIYAPYYNLLITKYATFLGSNNASISFDTIQIQKHALSLLNFAYHTAEQKQPLIQTPRFELKRVDWYELLVNRTLKADEVLVFDPTIVTTIKSNKDKASKPVDKFRLVQSLNEFLKVNLFSLQNATAFVKVPERSLDVVLRGYNTTFNVLGLINSGSINSGMDAIYDFSFKTLRVKNPDFNVQVENFKFDKRGFVIGNITYDSKPNVLINLEGLQLSSLSWSESNNSISFNGVGWNNLHAKIEQSENVNSRTQKSEKRELPNIYVKSINGGNSLFSFKNEKLNVRTALDHFNLNEITFEDSLQLNGINLKGNSLLIDTRLNEVRMGSYFFSDEGGTIHDIWFNRNTEDYLNVGVGRLAFKANLPELVQQKFVLNELSLDNVKARYSKRDSLQSIDIDAESQLLAHDLHYNNKNFSVGSLALDFGPFVVSSTKRVKNDPEEEVVTTKSGMRRFRGSADSLMQVDYSLKNLKRSDRRMKMPSADSDTAAFVNKPLRIKSDKGGVKLKLANINTSLVDSTTRVNANVNAIQFSEVDFATDKLIAWINNGSINNLVIDSERAKNPWSLIEDNYSTAGLQNVKGKIEVNGNLIGFDKLDYHPNTFSGSIHQFEFRPLKERQQFLDDSYYQTNYMDTRIESIAFNRFNVKRFLKDTVVELANIQIISPSLEIDRDKTKPFFATDVKLLPTNAFQKLNVGFKVDTLKVSDGKISYTEKSRITGKEGTINFSQLNALVRNVKNIDLAEGDSLYIRASTTFMDSAKVRLRVRESYADTLAGFVLTSQVSPFHTSILNKALVPMVSVDFKSGVVDTLYMRAIGREYISLGSMKFLYHDLKVEFLDKEDTSRHSLKNQLLKFAANTFVVKTNNKNRVGEIFYERDRNRAVFQYWVKMILSGVTTSVGAKSNKKQLRRYKKDLNQKKLPPIEVDLDL